MPRFVSFVGNEKYDIGCTGQTVFVYNKNGVEMAKFKGLKYAYDSIISPKGDIFVVKTTEGTLAVFSLDKLSLVKKFRFSKVNYAQDDGFCFSSDGKYFLNIERQVDDLHSAISVYDTSDFSRVSQFMLDGIGVAHIEQYENEYYVLGEVFVGKYKDNNITDILEINENEYWFYLNYISDKLSGKITDDCHSLHELWEHYFKLNNGK